MATLTLAVCSNSPQQNPRPQVALAFKPIRYSARQVALMAQAANFGSDAFIKATYPHLSWQFASTWLADLVQSESPAIPPKVARYFDLKQRGEEFAWIPR